VRCPICLVDDDRVIDSRSVDSGASIRRRRECNACGRRFTTYERSEKTGRLMVVKRDGSRVPFEPTNLLRGLQAACGKRPIPEEAKARLVREVEDELYREFEREVPSREIGRRLALRLRSIDEVAYIRFASEYHDFRNLEDFRTELDDLHQRPAPTPGQSPLFEEPSAGGDARRE
jgi:transcriptional repressor NrdR